MVDPHQNHHLHFNFQSLKKLHLFVLKSGKNHLKCVFNESSKCNGNAMAFFLGSRGPFVKKMSFISSLSNFFCSSTKHLLFMLLSKFTLNAVVGGLYGKNYHHASLVRISYCLPTLNLQPVCVLYQTTRNMHCMLAFINVTKF